jgi:hypothetical protein
MAAPERGAWGRWAGVLQRSVRAVRVAADDADVGASEDGVESAVNLLSRTRIKYRNRSPWSPLRTIEGVFVDAGPLALWTIVEIRWPFLAD